MPQVLVGDSRERLSHRLKVGKHYERRKCDNQPRPCAKRIVQKVEEDRRACRVALVLRREHPLRDKSAAARLRAGIPRRPPLHRKRKNHHRHHRGTPAGVRSRRDKRQPRLDRRVREERSKRSARAVHAACIHGKPGNCNRSGHGDDILVEVRPDRPRQSAENRIKPDDRHGDQKRRQRGKPEEHRAYLYGGEGRRAHHNRVEEYAEVDCAKSAQEACGLAGVPQFVEAEVGVKASPPPQLRIDERRKHPRQEKRPPHPVAGNAMVADDVRYQVRRVARERTCDHRHSKKPPRHVAS